MMELTRWDPFTLMDRMMADWNRMMERTFQGSIFGRPLPAVEIEETDKEIILRAEVPGISPEDLEVRVTESAFHLRGTIRGEQHREENRYFHTERRYGAFQRTLTLPARVDPVRSTAKYQNGILEVRAPKTESQQDGHRLKIELA